MKAFWLGAAMLIAACTPQQEEPSEVAAQVPDETVDQVATLDGHWRVAGIDGAEVQGEYAIALTGDERAIWWEPRCAGQSVDYTIDGTSFSATDTNGPDQIVCDIGFPAELDQLWSAMTAADTIERTPENGISISGNGRSVLLFSQ